MGRGETKLLLALVGVASFSRALMIIAELPETEDVVEFRLISGAVSCRNLFVRMTL